MQEAVQIVKGNYTGRAGVWAVQVLTRKCKELCRSLGCAGSCKEMQGAVQVLGCASFIRKCKELCRFLGCAGFYKEM